MRTRLEGPSDWQASVIAVPPMARTRELDFAAEPTARLIRHIEAGGVSIVMCGGNAGFHHVALSEYERILDCLETSVGADAWVIPAIGPAFGTMRDQAAILARRDFPAAMVLPTPADVPPEGLCRAIRHIAERLARPLVIYVRSETALGVDQIAALDRDGCVLFVKYSIARDDPMADVYLARLVDAIGVEKIVSGVGERPAPAHFRGFGLKAFTTGSGAIAPAASMRLLRALQSRDYEGAGRIGERFIELESLRDRYGSARVLHAAVTLAGVADMGPMPPLMSDIPDAIAPEVARAARRLAAADALAGVAA